MDTTSATSSIIASLGGGSGIDMAALAENLAAAQFAGRIDRLTARSEKLDRQISAASNLKNMLLSLQTSLGSRVREGDLSPQPQIANSAVARASLSGSRQPSGSFSLEVTALARGQTLASAPYAAATDPVGSGTLTLRFGEVAGTGFTEDTAHAPVSITIASGAKLTDVAAAINGANAGVTAYIATTIDGAQLVLKGTDGLQNGFILEASETVGEPGLANLAWTPASTTGALLSTANNASFEVDGLEMTSPGNTVSEAIPGVTLTLTGTNIGAPTRVTFGDPASAISAAMQDLTGALNEIAAELGLSGSPQSGDLARDDGLRALRRAFSGLAGATVMPLATGTNPRTLSDLGLSTQRDGTFLMDTARLAATLKADPAGAAAMFTNGIHGVFATIDNIVRSASRTSDPGSLSASIARYTAQKSKTGTEQAELAEDQEKLRARMIQRFAGTDGRVGQLKSTLAFLKNQIDAWNAQSRN
jgi:flagellar hook-associated protein 2